MTEALKTTEATVAAADVHDTVEARDMWEALSSIDEKLTRMDRVLDDLGRRVEGMDELKHDLVPIANQAFSIASKHLVRWEEAGALDFMRESSRVLETIATSFSEEDVRFLGENVVSILKTVRNLTQPEVLDVADRAAVALQHPDEKQPGLLKSLRDPEVRRGMTLLLSVLRELGHESRTPARA